MGLRAVVEQALAIAQLLTDDSGDCPGILASEVCSRSGCEIGARSWWLLDPAVSTRERLAWHFYLQLESALELEALGRAIGWPVGDLSYSQPTLDVCLDRCRDLGLPWTIVRDRSGRERVQDVDGARLPAATTLVSEFMRKTGYGPDSHMVYRLQSATSHGTYYALIRSYRANDQSASGGLVRRVPDQRVVEASAGLTLWAFSELLGRVVDLMGWPWIRAESFRQMIDSHLSQEP